MKAIKTFLIISFLTWLLTVAGFIGFVFYAQGKTLPSNGLVSNLVLADIGIGVVSFIVMSLFLLIYAVKKRQLKTAEASFLFKRRGSNGLALGVFILVLLCIGLISLDGRAAAFLSARDTKPQASSIPFVYSPPVTQSPTPKPSSYKPVSTTDTDPVADCGPGQKSGQFVRVKKSECPNYVDCGFLDGTWKMMRKDYCTNAQKAEAETKRAKYNTEPLVDCVLSYGTFKLYQSTCNNFKMTDGKTYVPVSNTTPQPQPTQSAQDDAYYQELLKKHEQACNDAVAEWVQVKESFMANEYNNYNSSAEAVMALTQKMNEYQQELYAVGCSNTVSL